MKAIQVITHNTGQTELITDYGTPLEESLAIFTSNSPTREHYRWIVDEIHRAKNMSEVWSIVEGWKQ
jgi:hypothetical protein